MKWIAGSCVMLPAGGWLRLPAVHFIPEASFLPFVVCYVVY